MRVSLPTTDRADAIVDQWVALAADQREHGSHVLADENRQTARESILRRIVADELLVATADDDVVGFVTFATETGQYRQDVTRGVVQNLFVLPSHRGRGIGADLLSAAEDHLRERGAAVVALEVLADNEEARRFYRRHGYEPHRFELEQSLESDTP